MANGAELKVPDHLEGGVYANFASVWYTRSEFTVDFSLRPANDDLLEVARLVSRVRLPTIFVFELIRKLSVNMTDYEREHGEIPRFDDMEES